MTEAISMKPAQQDMNPYEILHQLVQISETAFGLQVFDALSI